MGRAVVRVPNQPVKQDDPGSPLMRYLKRSQQQRRKLEARFGPGAGLVLSQVDALRELATLDLTKADPESYQRYIDTVNKSSCKLSLSQEHVDILHRLGRERVSQHLVAYVAAVEHAVQYDTTLSDLQRRTKLALGRYNLAAFAFLGVDVAKAHIKRLEKAGVQAFGEEEATKLFKLALKTFETDKAAMERARRVTRVSSPTAGNSHLASSRSNRETATRSSGRINKVGKPGRSDKPGETEIRMSWRQLTMVQRSQTL